LESRYLSYSIFILVFSIEIVTVLATTNFNYDCTASDSGYNCGIDYYATDTLRTYAITMRSKTMLGVQFLGLKVRVDRERTTYSTPFSLNLVPGLHTLTASNTAGSSSDRSGEIQRQGN
jgi:hypothetical protein